MTTDNIYMQRALELAQKAAREGEVPVGAVLVLNNEIIAETFNQPIAKHDATAHAEIQAIRQAGEKLNNYRLPGSALYVTLEPCPMCAGAMVHARIDRLIFATPDPRSGAAGSVLQLLQNPQLNHRVNVEQGILAEEAKALLQSFFKARRS